MFREPVPFHPDEVESYFRIN